MLNLFGMYFIKSGKLDKKFARMLKNLKDDRENGDYEVFSTIDEEIAEQTIGEAKEFLKAARQHLKKYTNGRE